VTGERVTFLRTARDTDGKSVLIEVSIKPGGAVAAADVHPHRTERFEVTSGSVEFRLGRRKVMARGGEVVTVEPGTLRTFQNAGEDEAGFVTEVTPALGFESFLETMVALAADGKTSKRGMPNPLRLAVIANEHFDLVRLPYVPAACRRPPWPPGRRSAARPGTRRSTSPRARPPRPCRRRRGPLPKATAELRLRGRYTCLSPRP
jgi:mannose-6-phosphate isomerase-like protein (cupin superfamily)